MICPCKAKDIDPKRPKSEQKWCLYTKDGKKLLGRHPTKERAVKQERAVQIHKHSSVVNRLRSAATALKQLLSKG